MFYSRYGSTGSCKVGSGADVVLVVATELSPATVLLLPVGCDLHLLICMYQYQRTSNFGSINYVCLGSTMCTCSS